MENMLEIATIGVCCWSYAKKREESYEEEE